MSVLLLSPEASPSFFKWLRSSIQSPCRDVMLHFVQKLGADAQSHVFMGRRISEFQARRVNQLRAELKKGYWAAGVGYYWLTKHSVPGEVKRSTSYAAGADAKASYAMRLQIGDEAFRKAINEQFCSDDPCRVRRPKFLTNSFFGGCKHLAKLK